jgi:hypothetical protein
MLVCPICGMPVDRMTGTEEVYTGEDSNNRAISHIVNVEWYECTEHGEVEPVDEYDYWYEEVNE